jgi:Zn-dependent M28 family amino/carboxypeptidase
MNLMRNSSILIILLIIFFSCSGRKKDFNNALSSIKTKDLENYVSELGSDRFMGRKPFTRGEAITINYLADHLKLIGFEPAFNGSYFQEVPMVEISSSIKGIEISGSSEPLFFFSTPDEAAVVSPQICDTLKIINSEIIFAGFGIVAPEYGWNDYANLDVKGKTVIVLINDPGLYIGDSLLFKGREMTYYGRWTYKYEEAARQGAAGILIVHETEGAGYPYSVPRKSSITPRFYMENADSNQSMCRFTGWMSAEAAEKLFSEAGYSVEKLRMESCGKGFTGFTLNRRLSLTINNTVRYNKSTNVAGILKGTRRSQECIVYTAHWDHFGIGEKENGDSVYNGAVDNGTTMAWALSVGNAFTQLKRKPERSIIILFPTCEEQGLIGSVYYTDNPVLPLARTVACINNDLMLPIGRMKDVMITGFGQSELDDYTARAAALQDRYVVGDPNSHTGMFFRSDHFAFASKGVPSLYARGNTDSREFGRDWAAAQEKDYIENRYHKPADNYEPDKWNLEGIAEDAELAFTIGYELAFSRKFPEWNANSEFRNLRNR